MRTHASSYARCSEMRALAASMRCVEQWCVSRRCTSLRGLRRRDHCGAVLNACACADRCAVAGRRALFAGGRCARIALHVFDGARCALASSIRRAGHDARERSSLRCDALRHGAFVSEFAAASIASSRPMQSRCERMRCVDRYVVRGRATRACFGVCSIWRDACRCTSLRCVSMCTIVDAPTRSFIMMLPLRNETDFRRVSMQRKSGQVMIECATRVRAVRRGLR